MNYPMIQKLEEIKDLEKANELLSQGWVLIETKKTRRELDHPEFYDAVTYILGLPSDLKRS